MVVNAVRAADRALLREYAYLSVDVLYDNLVHLGSDITTIALLRGPTLGAGLEAALSCDVVVAERGVQMGFPEVLFNLFPGMGAYSFLSRKISPAIAERMILSGKMYSAEQLYDLGLVHYLADDGASGEVVTRIARGDGRTGETRMSLLRMREILAPVRYEELKDIVELWVDSAFRLSDYNLQMMERLLRAQNWRYAKARE